MKVLFIGHYREQTGWGRAIREYILAMDTVGIDIVTRPVLLNNTTAEIPDRIKELENKSAVGCDVCIQYLLPHYFVYDGKFKKNIGMYLTETIGIKHTIWPNYINMMDEVWVPNKEMYIYRDANGNKKPIYIIPIPTDVSLYTREYKPIDKSFLNGDFSFYFIGEFNKRKRLSAVIQAFHSEFDNNEPVSLIIKTNKSGITQADLSNEVANLCEKIKVNIRKYQNTGSYKKENVIVDFIPENDMYRLHTSFDCLVLPSYGEAWSYPVFDAMALGNFPIVTKSGGPADYIQHQDNGLFIDGRLEPVFGADASFPTFGSSRELWVSVSIDDLMDCMRFAYENRHLKDKHRECGLITAQQHSRENIGKMMLERLTQ